MLSVCPVYRWMVWPMNNNVDEFSAKVSIVSTELYWEKLINTDIKRNMYFPSDYDKDRFIYDKNVQVYKLL